MLYSVKKDQHGWRVTRLDKESGQEIGVAEYLFDTAKEAFMQAMDMNRRSGLLPMMEPIDVLIWNRAPTCLEGVAK